MKKYGWFALTFIILSPSFCTLTQFRRVDNPNVAFERPDYSVLAPAGCNCQNFDDNSNSRLRSDFFNKIPDLKFHSLEVGIV
jgi:hypothetical protein